MMPSSRNSSTTEPSTTRCSEDVIVPTTMGVVAAEGSRLLWLRSTVTAASPFCVMSPLRRGGSGQSIATDLTQPRRARRIARGPPCIRLEPAAWLARLAVPVVCCCVCRLRVRKREGPALGIGAASSLAIADRGVWHQDVIVVAARHVCVLLHRCARAVRQWLDLL